MRLRESSSFNSSGERGGRLEREPGDSDSIWVKRREAWGSGTLDRGLRAKTGKEEQLCGRAWGEERDSTRGPEVGCRRGFEGDVEEDNSEEDVEEDDRGGDIEEDDTREDERGSTRGPEVGSRRGSRRRDVEEDDTSVEDVEEEEVDESNSFVINTILLLLLLLL